MGIKIGTTNVNFEYGAGTGSAPRIYVGNIEVGTGGGLPDWVIERKYWIDGGQYRDTEIWIEEPWIFETGYWSTDNSVWKSDEDWFFTF